MMKCALTASKTISNISNVTTTCIASNGIDTVCIYTAVVSPQETFIDVHTGSSITHVTWVTGAQIAPYGVGTGSIRWAGTGVVSSRALIHIYSFNTQFNSLFFLTLTPYQCS